MSDPERQRRPLGFFKIPDIENPDEDTINAVADAIYQQLMEQIRASRENDPNGPDAGADCRVD